MDIIVLYNPATMSGQWSILVGHEIMVTRELCEHQVLTFVKLPETLPVQRHVAKEYLPHLPQEALKGTPQMHSNRLKCHRLSDSKAQGMEMGSEVAPRSV